LDAATGTLKREFDLAGPAASAPVIANGRIYVADVRRQLYCFGASTLTPALSETR
jgi:outer membrane protein assembly factor BamB